MRRGGVTMPEQERCDQRNRRLAGILVRSLAVALLGLTGSCTRIDNLVNESASPAHVFSVGYESLVERYIDPVDVRRTALLGLSSLVAMDPDLDMSEDNLRIGLRAGRTAIAEWPTPPRSDYHGWAEVSARFVAAAQANSIIIRGRSSADLYTAVFDGALTNFDRYSRYASAERARQRQASRDGFGGLGVSIDQRGGHTTIVEVHEDTPAMRAGLEDGDVLTHADGKPLSGLSQDRVIGLLRGPIDSRVDLTVERPGVDKPLTISVVRRLIVLPTVKADLDGDLLILRITGFNHGTASAIRTEIDSAIRRREEPIKGIVLDVRNNPGGLLDQAVRVADLFLAEGRIVSTKGRHRASDQIFDATKEEVAQSLPLAVLVNGKSASAAEIVAAALQDRERAVVLGSSSYGKGSVQTIVRLPNGGELTLTWARLFSPSGFPLEDRGVIPAICTNGGGKSVEEIRKELLSVVDGAGGPFLAQLRSHHAKADQFRAFRAECPPSSSKPDADIEIARLVMSNDVLYGRIVHHGRSSLAARQ